MQHLLLLTENYPPDRGGMSVSCDRIVRGLRREGVRVDVVRLDRRAPDAAHEINMTWNRLRRRVIPSVVEGAGREAARETGPEAAHPRAPGSLDYARDDESTQITHVVAFGGYLPILAGPAFAAWIGKPLVTLIRGNELDAGLFDPRRRPLLDDALRRSAVVCTVTTEQAEKIAALYPGIEPRVIANGIDFELWQATDADVLRAAAFRDASRRVLGFFGHLKSKKGVPFFLDALRRSGRADAFHLLLVGDAADEIDETSLSVTRVATVDRFELIPLYLACDLVVIPSHYDGFPNVLIEAAALARPLIASRVGGMRDLLDERSALLFDPGDEHACRAAIESAFRLSDHDLARLGAHAQAVARQRCDAREEARRYAAALPASVPSPRGAGREAGVRGFS
jgi:glycogen(starch) synthase